MKLLDFKSIYTTCIVLSVLFLFNSCKKNEQSISETQIIANAKDWFLKEKNIFYLPSWDKVEIIRENKVTYLIIPSNFNIDSGDNTVVSRLIIADSSGTHSAKLFELINSDVPASSQDILSIYKGGQTLKSLNSKFSGSLIILDSSHMFLYGRKFLSGSVISNISIKFSQTGSIGLKDRKLMTLQPPPEVPVTPVCTD